MQVLLKITFTYFKKIMNFSFIVLVTSNAVGMFNKQDP